MIESLPMGPPEPFTNRLRKETSPYLVQHAHNPVDWYPWGEEALQASREQDKPILLSIGYSSCHWCHVMEHQCFENEEIAGLMNEHFINIKVDREERPDLDAIYMHFVQMTTGSGGWPLTVFLTPEQVPFFGGTYFPPEDSYGRPGFKRVLSGLAEVYRTRREEMDGNREEIVERLKKSSRWEVPEGSVEEGIFQEAFSRIEAQFDSLHGGFGDAPKFPTAMVLRFLLRYHRRTGSGAALDMVRKSLDEMAAGGLYDQAGGGFHRYTVDEKWLVPHFEKMLYDNALLCRLYLEAYQVTGEADYREVVEETLAYVERELRDPGGGFYSSQDADSEGVEGKYYVWTPAEVRELLGEEEAAVFCDFFDVTEDGNFEGKNILHRPMSIEAAGRKTGMAVSELKALLDRGRAKLRAAREKRIKPALDDKVLAAWNGLMLSAFAQAGFVLAEERWLKAARANAEFLAEEILEEGRLKRSWKGGVARLNGYLEDYALIIEGWLDLYEATGESRWLEQADRLMKRQFELFWDETEGDFYFTSLDHERLLIRQKEYLDNAIPSGNSASCLNLLRLGVLKGEADYLRKGERALRRMAQGLSASPLAFGRWLQALDFWVGPRQEMAVVGGSGDHEKILQPLRDTFLPNKVLAISDDSRPEAANGIPLLRDKKPLEGRSTFFLCRDFTCREPVTEAEQVRAMLKTGA